MSMPLEEYKKMLDEDFFAASEVSSTNTNVEFLNFVTETFNDSEEVFDLVQCYFSSTGEYNRKIKIDAYAYEEADKSFTLVISKYDRDEEINTITKTEIDSYVKQMVAFIENTASGYIKRNTEFSSDGYQVADMLGTFIRNGTDYINKFKLYVVTNSKLSERVKTIKGNLVCGYPTEISVWDLQRFYDSDINNHKKEPIFIDFSNYMDGEGLQAIKAYDGNSDYTAYLAVIPGTVLAKLYDEYGSRLLEGNVRSFLSDKGNVNKGIKETILKRPEYFFTYNNGIATTATELKTKNTGNGLVIEEVKDLQIINGGQTTASLLNTKIKYPKDTRLEEVYVAMKLTVINTKEDDVANQMVENISRCANSQNKVSDADFFSNSPFHVNFEKMSKQKPAPAINGNQYQTWWFYERARGSYKQEQMKLTKSQRDKFALLHPKSQVISKTDLAKYMNSIYQMPDKVSKGAQKNMKSFATLIETKFKESNPVDEYFYKQAISAAIIFKHMENSVSTAEWFPSGSGYRANVVTYAISKLFNCIEKQFPRASIDYNAIWNKQTVYKELSKVLDEIAEMAFKHLSDEKRPIMNISEWSKKEECWTLFKEKEYTLPEYFVRTLVSNSEVQGQKVSARKEQKREESASAMITVFNLGAAYWQRLKEKAMEYKVCNIIEQGDLDIAIRMERTGRTPNEVQSKRLLQFREKCSKEGIDVDNL